MSSFEIFVDHELKLVRITARGEIFLNDGEKIITAGRTTAAEHDYPVLYDIREATTTVTIANWYFLPRNLPVFQEAKTSKVKAAVLASPRDKAVKGYKFYENVTANMGFQLRVFFDESEALRWLQSAFEPES